MAKGASKKSQGDPAKPQPSLGDYNAWIMSRLVEERGEKSGTVAGWIIDRWIEQNKKHLAEEYGITRDGYRAQKGLARPGSDH